MLYTFLKAWKSFVSKISLQNNKKFRKMCLDMNVHNAIVKWDE